MKILYEDNHLIVVVKERGILSQSDGSATNDMLSILKSYIKEKYHKPGNVYLGLVHRLDKETGGIMVFARTTKAARRLSEQIRNHQFEKWYLAVCQGTLESGKMKDYLKRVDYKSIISNEKDGKIALLSYEALERKQNTTLVRVKLETGRHHQIRVQFKEKNHPLLGDAKYGKKGTYPLALFAYHLGFYHPVTRKKMTFEEIPDYGYFHAFRKELL